MKKNSISFFSKQYSSVHPKENDSNPFLYSYSKYIPFSFMTGHTKYSYNSPDMLKSPSPVFIPTEEWCRAPDLSKASILSGMVISDKKGLVLVDKDISKKFHNLLKYLLSNLLIIAVGKKVSLKVTFFEPKSMLQRITDYWSYFLTYIPKASISSISSIERMKNIMAFGISGLYIPTKQLKPFNPLIGETFEGSFNDGTQVYLEQISNYPTISRFLITNPDLKMHGFVDISCHTEKLGTRLLFLTKGYIRLDFTKINERITYIMPSIRMLKVTAEEGRSAYWRNNIIFFDVKNNLKGFISIGKNKGIIHNVKGYIIQFDYNTTQDKFIIDYDKEQEFANNFKPENSKYKVLAKCEGSWLQKLNIDGKTYWDIDKDLPTHIKPKEDCLPSDGRFREDLIWLYYSFYKYKNDEERKEYEGLAQSWKLINEKLQREEREEKAKYNKLLLEKKKKKV